VGNFAKSGKYLKILEILKNIEIRTKVQNIENGEKYSKL
jgi:hypothetical protein